MHVCVCVTESLCCTKEIGTTLYINYTPINIFKRNKPATILSPIFHTIGLFGLSFCVFQFAFATQRLGGSVTAAYIIFALNLLTSISFLILRFIKLSNQRKNWTM